MEPREESESNEVRGSISAWLALTSGLEPDSGLHPREARRRAAELLPKILNGGLRPEAVKPSEDFKDVLSALVASLREYEPADQHCQVADAVYQFISRIPWPELEADEKHDLLTECAEIGWGAMGITLADVTRRRVERGRARSLIAQCKTDPIDPLELPASERSADLKSDCLSNPDVLASICKFLWKDLNRLPDKVAEEAISVHKWLEQGETFAGLFDERHYFLGETALLAAVGSRIIGKREETANWLARAEGEFRHTINSAPHFANISYVRLALLYDNGRFEDVVDLAPSLIGSFSELKMSREEAKARLLKAAALKVAGRIAEALEDLAPLLENPEVENDKSLLARVLIDIGDSHQLEGRVGDALKAFQRASSLLEGEAATGTLGDLKLDIGALLRGQNHLREATEAFREAATIFLGLGLETRCAYLRVLTAETLISQNLLREAEWEILAALPTIEEQKMVPEGFAAVALLKESVRQRNADPNALRELREHLQASQK